MKKLQDILIVLVVILLGASLLTSGGRGGHSRSGNISSAFYKKEKIE